MVVVASLILVSITLFTSMLDARQQVRAFAMAETLEQANSQLEGADAERHWMDLRDPPTGLPNRVLPEHRLDRALNRISRQANYAAKRTPTKLAVVFIDRDGFKPVNDSYCHSAGDQVIRRESLRLNELIRDTDTAARTGRDEFLLLLEEVQRVASAAGLADRIVRSLGTPLQKISRSFTRDLDSSADARAVVDAVIRLEHSLGLRLVAEGVETAEQ